MTLTLAHLKAFRTMMTTSQVLPDLLTYNSMISAFVSGAQWELALNTLREAGNQGQFLPDVVSCLANMGSFPLKWGFSLRMDLCLESSLENHRIQLPCQALGGIVIRRLYMNQCVLWCRFQCCHHCLWKGLSVGDGSPAASRYATGSGHQMLKDLSFFWKFPQWLLSRIFQPGIHLYTVYSIGT